MASGSVLAKSPCSPAKPGAWLTFPVHLFTCILIWSVSTMAQWGSAYSIPPCSSNLFTVLSTSPMVLRVTRSWSSQQQPHLLVPTSCTYYSHALMTKIPLKKQLKGSSAYWAHGRSRLVHGGSSRGAGDSFTLWWIREQRFWLHRTPSQPQALPLSFLQQGPITHRLYYFLKHYHYPGPIIQTLKPGEGKFHIQTQTGTFQDCTNISTVHPQTFFIVPIGSFVTTR